MDKNLVTFDGSRTILNVNAITMVFSDNNENNLTYINVIGGNANIIKIGVFISQMKMAKKSFSI